MSIKENNLRRFENYEIDLEKKILWFENSPVELPVKAVELLCVLIESGGEVVKKDELLNKIWNDSFVEEGVLPQNVYLLRKLFKQHGIEETLIQTVSRRGYRFAGEVVETDEEEITVERETFERKFIAAGELSDKDFREVLNGLDDSQTAQIIELYKNGQTESHKSVVSAKKSFAFLFAALLSVLAIGFLIWFYIQPNNAQRGSAYAAPPDNQNLTYERITESGRTIGVGLSPDNQYAAYVIDTPENKYSLILQHLPTGSETVVIEPQEMHLFCIRFSPDGNYIYYGGGTVDKSISVFRIPLFGGVSEPVLKDFTHHFTVSPDGEWFAFFRRVPEENAQYLEIARTRDGSDKRTVTIRKDDEVFSIWGTAPAWSPDGKKLVAAAYTKNSDKKKRARSHLVEINVTDGTQTEIKSPDWYEVHEPYWQSDGKGIFLKVREKIGEPVQIWHLEYPTGEARNITNDTNDYREFRVATDSSFLMTATWSKSENLFLISAENPTNIRQLTFDTKSQNGAEGLNWTIDGKKLIYTKSKGYSVNNIWMINVETVETKQITNDKDSLQARIDTTLDGKSILYKSNSGGNFQVWQIDLDGTNPKQLTDDDSKDFSEISSDGKWIYYSTDRGLWKKSLEDGEKIRLTDKVPGRIRVSPTDPKLISAYYFDPNEKTKNPWKQVVFNTENFDEFTELDISPMSLFDWLPNGRKMYFVDGGESFNNIWTISPETLETEQITNFADQRISNMSLSPDGKTIAVSRGAATGNILKISGF